MICSFLHKISVAIIIYTCCLASSYAQINEMLCNTVFKTSVESKKVNDSCREVPDNCVYMLSVGSIFKAVQVDWYENGTVCGGNSYGDIRIEGRNISEGKLDFVVLRKDLNSEPHDVYENKIVVYRGILSKRLTNNLIIWEGSALANDGTGEQEIYIRRSRSSLDADNLSSQKSSVTLGSLDKSHLNSIEGISHDFHIDDNLHGAYYCGDGGCIPEGIGVIIKKFDKEAFYNRLKRSGLNYTDITENQDSDKRFSCRVEGAGNQLSEKLANALGIKLYDGEYPQLTQQDEMRLRTEYECLTIKAVPLMEPHLTMALREFPEVYNARRFGGGAGADGKSIFLRTTSFINDTNSLDIQKAIDIFDVALRAYYPETSSYTLSPVLIRNNSLFWDIKGRRAALEKRNNAKGIDHAEWWKVRIQLFVSQSNFQEYILLLSLPETRSIQWGFNSMPVDAKFSTELTNDDRFLDYRDRLVGILTKEIDGVVILP